MSSLCLCPLACCTDSLSWSLLRAAVFLISRRWLLTFREFISKNALCFGWLSHRLTVSRLTDSAFIFIISHLSPIGLNVVLLVLLSLSPVFVAPCEALALLARCGGDFRLGPTGDLGTCSFCAVGRAALESPGPLQPTIVTAFSPRDMPLERSLSSLDFCSIIYLLLSIL